MKKHIGHFPKCQSYQANVTGIRPAHLISDTAPGWKIVTFIQAAFSSAEFE